MILAPALELLVVLTAGPERVHWLRRRFEERASVLDVYLALTQTCRFQREVGSRTPNVYGMTCKAKLDTTGGPTMKSLPSRI